MYHIAQFVPTLLQNNANRYIFLLKSNFGKFSQVSVLDDRIQKILCYINKGGKRIKKAVVALLTTIILLFAFMSPVYADGYICSHGYHTFGDYGMSYGVGQYGANHRYFWMGGLNSTYMTYSRNAVSQWVHTSTTPGVTTSISIIETSNRPSAMFEIVGQSDLGSGYWAEHIFTNTAVRFT
ncbi:MAG: hypothetical protein ACOX88_06545 [Christensenellales bacterium]